MFTISLCTIQIALIKGLSAQQMRGFGIMGSESDPSLGNRLAFYQNSQTMKVVPPRAVF